MRQRRFDAEGASPEVEFESVREALRRCLAEHVVDVSPNWDGRDADRGKVSGAMVGAVEAEISRCHPPRNIVLTREGNRTRFDLSKTSPLAYAQRTIEEAKRSAGRLKVAA